MFGYKVGGANELPEVTVPHQSLAGSTCLASMKMNHSHHARRHMRAPLSTVGEMVWGFTSQARKEQQKGSQEHLKVHNDRGWDNAQYMQQREAKVTKLDTNGTGQFREKLDLKPNVCCQSAYPFGKSEPVPTVPDAGTVLQDQGGL